MERRPVTCSAELGKVSAEVCCYTLQESPGATPAGRKGSAAHWIWEHSLGIPARGRGKVQEDCASKGCMGNVVLELSVGLLVAVTLLLSTLSQSALARQMAFVQNCAEYNNTDIVQSTLCTISVLPRKAIKMGVLFLFLMVTFPPIRNQVKPGCSWSVILRDCASYLILIWLLLNYFIFTAPLKLESSSALRILQLSTYAFMETMYFHINWMMAL